MKLQNLPQCNTHAITVGDAITVQSLQQTSTKSIKKILRNGSS